MRSISMAYPTIDLAATGAHIRQLRLEQGYSVQDLQTYLGLWGIPMDKIIVEQAA